MSERATFAAGCFWGIEASFRALKGVVNTRVGYTGGHLANPTYAQVSSGETGHAEAVEVEFDPKKISYEQLLNHFWKIHDPTTLNAQGPDVGEQYRSAIFYHTPQQKESAETSKMSRQRSLHPRKIVTEIVPLITFYVAEEYHQRYLDKQGGSCSSHG